MRGVARVPVWGFFEGKPKGFQDKADSFLQFVVTIKAPSR